MFQAWLENQFVGLLNRPRWNVWTVNWRKITFWSQETQNLKRILFKIWISTKKSIQFTHSSVELSGLDDVILETRVTDIDPFIIQKTPTIEIALPPIWISLYRSMGIHLSIVKSIVFSYQLGLPIVGTGLQINIVSLFFALSWNSILNHHPSNPFNPWFSNTYLS